MPLIAVLLALGPVLLPELRDRGAARLDTAGAALSLAGVLSAVYGLKRAVQSGLDPVAGVALAIGLGLVAAFLRRQHRQADPWIDLALFRRRDFSLPLAANALCFFVLYGTQFFIAQYLQLVLGLSALEAGLWTIPSALGYLAGSMLAPLAANRFRPAWTLSASLAVTAVGFGLLTQVGPQSGLPFVVAGSVIVSVGLAPVYVLTTELTVAAAPPPIGDRVRPAHDHGEPRRSARDRVPRQPRRRDLPPWRAERPPDDRLGPRRVHAGVPHRRGRRRGHDRRLRRRQRPAAAAPAAPA